MNDTTKKFLDQAVEDAIKFEQPDHTDYKGQLAVQDGNEAVLRRKIMVLEQQLREAKDDPRYRVNIQRDHCSLDYVLNIRLDSMLLQRHHPGGSHEEYLRPIAVDIMHKSMKALMEVINESYRPAGRTSPY